MKCANCGAEFAEGNFCPECGTKYDEEEALAAELIRIEEEKKQKQLEIEKQTAEKQRLEDEKRELIAAKEEKRKDDDSKIMSAVSFAFGLGSVMCSFLILEDMSLERYGLGLSCISIILVMIYIRDRLLRRPIAIIALILDIIAIVKIILIHFR